MAGKRKSGQGANPKQKAIRGGAPTELVNVKQITDWFLGMMVNGAVFFFESHLKFKFSCFEGCAML